MLCQRARRPGAADSTVLVAGLMCWPPLYEVGKVAHLFLSESCIHRYERHGSDRDDDPDIGVKNGHDKVVSLLETPIEGRLSVRDHRLDPPANLERPVWIIGVLDMEGNPRVVFEVAVLLPVAGMRKADSLPVPGKPHHAALGTSIRAKGGEMSEERSLKQVSMALGNLGIGHLRNPFGSVHGLKFVTPAWKTGRPGAGTA